MVIDNTSIEKIVPNVKCIDINITQIGQKKKNKSSQKMRNR